MKALLEKKLELAQQRKANLRHDITEAKITNEMQHFSRHWLFREDENFKNAQLIEHFQQIQRKNIEVALNFLRDFSFVIFLKNHSLFHILTHIFIFQYYITEKKKIIQMEKETQKPSENDPRKRRGQEDNHAKRIGFAKAK